MNYTYSYSDYWNVPYQTTPDQYSSHPQWEMVREAKENSNNTRLISQPPQTGEKFQNEAAMNGSRPSRNASFPVFKDEVIR